MVAAVDRSPDEIPFQDPNYTEPAPISGNHVVVDIGGGRYAYYAHLKPGSVRVAVGQRVRAGQQLGQVGNSGNTTCRTCTSRSWTRRRRSRRTACRS